MVRQRLLERKSLNSLLPIHSEVELTQLLLLPSKKKPRKAKVM